MYSHFSEQTCMLQMLFNVYTFSHYTRLFEVSTISYSVQIVSNINAKIQSSLSTPVSLEHPSSVFVSKIAFLYYFFSVPTKMSFQTMMKSRLRVEAHQKGRGGGGGGGERNQLHNRNCHT